MKALGFACLLMGALALPATADEGSAIAGMWFGTHSGYAVIPADGGRCAPESPTTNDRCLARRVGPGLIVLELEAQGADLGGTITLASAQRREVARRARALVSLGVTTPSPGSDDGALHTDSYTGAITGTVKNERIAFTARTANVRVRGIVTASDRRAARETRGTNAARARC